MHLLIYYSFPGLWPPNDDVLVWFCIYLDKQDMSLRKAISKFKLHIHTLQTAAPCIVDAVITYLRNGFYLHALPWCCHTSWSLLGKNKWGEVGWWELAAFIMLMSVWHRQIYYIRKRLFFSFSCVITLKQFSGMGWHIVLRICLTTLAQHAIDADVTVCVGYSCLQHLFIKGNWTFRVNIMTDCLLPTW